MLKNLFIPVLFIALNFESSLSQELTQTIRGKVVDKVTNRELTGATVVIMGTDPIQGAITDITGRFRITKVQIGSHNVKISYIGYQEFILYNLVVNSGKELVLNIPLEEEIIKMEEIVIRPEVDKEKPLNELAAVSARTFSVEETQKFAGSFNDPGRMVASFAGVTQTDDGNNMISIRGNSPYGLQWKMEGVEIPNPNHFGRVGSSGGGVSVLSSQLLSNSDFLTGAFPAEYGNALAGVFDLNLRKGNNEQREYTLQAGFLGIDLAAEGPFSKRYKGSYLVNYRYSTLSLLSQLGVPIGDAIINFQDISYNVFIPSGKSGSFSFFGFGGLSDQNFDAPRDSAKWNESYDRYDFNYHTNTGMAGLKHAITIKDKTFLQTSLVYSGFGKGYVEDRISDTYMAERKYKDNSVEEKINANLVMNNKMNAQHSLRSGIYVTNISYSLVQKEDLNLTGQMLDVINSNGNTQILQAFSQWNYRINQNLTFNLGFHYLNLFLNNTYSIEPRSSLQYQLNEKQSVSLGYGLHSQVQPIGVYFGQLQTAEGIILPNKDLKLSKSHHIVLSYDRTLKEHLRLKTEAYYQYLFDIPISADPAGNFSLINSEGNYATEPLVNDGVGRNYGLEVTFEQFMHRNLYYLFSGSLYDAKYKAHGEDWINTRFNGNFTLTFTGGKEFQILRNNKYRVLGINLKTIYTGGFRTTPIDIQQSIAEGQTIWMEDKAFTGRATNYFRTDVRISWKRNRLKSTSIVSLDIQNVTNNQNIYGEYFDAESGTIEKWYQAPLIPILSYRLEF